MFQCTDYFNDYDVQRIIADNYDNMNNQEKAEEHYIIASRMIPNRFVPLYQLFRLYEKNGRTNEAMRTAKAIIEMPVKVQSNCRREDKILPQKRFYPRQMPKNLPNKPYRKKMRCLVKLSTSFRKSSGSET